MIITEPNARLLSCNGSNLDSSPFNHLFSLSLSLSLSLSHYRFLISAVWLNKVTRCAFKMAQTIITDVKIRLDCHAPAVMGTNYIHLGRIINNDYSVSPGTI